MLVQYFEYLGNVLHFDFGTTFADNRQVLDIIRDQGGATLTLTLGAFLFALAIGLPLGRLAGRYRDTPLDAVIRVFGVITYAAPIFWVGIMIVVLVVAWLPGVADRRHRLGRDQVPDRAEDPHPARRHDPGRRRRRHRDVLQHHVFPCLTLGLLLSGVIIRLVRINVIQALKGDYVEAARARGISEGRVVRKHAFRNALVPVITVVGLQIALTLSGAVLTETTFNWPGLGTELVEYVTKRDYIAVQGLVTFFAVIVVLVSLFVDILNALVDPRVRY